MNMLTLRYITASADDPSVIQFAQILFILIKNAALEYDGQKHNAMQVDTFRIMFFVRLVRRHTLR